MAELKALLEDERPLWPTSEQVSYGRQAADHEKEARRHEFESSHDDHPPGYQELHRLAGKMQRKLAQHKQRMADWRPQR